MLGSGMLQAQVYSVPSCTPLNSSTTYGPMYTTTTSGATNRMAVIYPASELADIANSTITSLYFTRATATGSLTGNPSFKVYLKNVVATDFGTGSLTWATEISGSTLVYDGNPASIVGSSAGSKMFPLSTNFSFSSGNLAVYFEYTNTAANSTSISWNYEANSGCVNTANNNTSKYTNVTTGVLPASLATSNYRRPLIAFDILQTACNSAPTPATISASSSSACPTNPVTLTATNLPNLATSGISYQWQSSAAGANNFSDINLATSSTYISSQSANTDYRFKMTCTATSSSSFSNVITVTSPPLVSGTFTINSAIATGGTNFQTFNAFFAYLACGINGPVTANVVSGSGPYNEQVIIPEIFGTSATNTITVNGNGATVNYVSTVSAQRGVFILNGTDYLTLNGLTITSIGVSGTFYGAGVFLTNDADYNTINGCTISVDQSSSTSTNHTAIALSGSTTSYTGANSNCDFNTITNNVISGGYYGITQAGATNNTIQGNEIKAFALYGVWNSVVFQRTN